MMKRLFARFIAGDHGQDLVEYVFLAVFIALVVVLSLQSIGTTVNTQMSNIGALISSGT